MVQKIQDLLDIMAQLRSNETGCPWDSKQTFTTIAPYTIEEAYEVVDAIDRNNMEDLKSELGDLLLQVVFHARIAEEQNEFTFSDVIETISNKMIERHPHVFGNRELKLLDENPDSWESMKATERKNDGKHEIDVTLALPALMRAEKIGKRAARMGFDWPDIESVFCKIKEELNELIDAESSKDTDQSLRVKEEFGDFLFATSNLARHLGIDPEEALRKANHKFQRRFKEMELKISENGKTVAFSTLNELEKAWNAVKENERNAKSL